MKKLVFALFLCCAFTAISAQSTTSRAVPSQSEVKPKPVKKINSRVAQKQKAAVIQKYKARNRYRVVNRGQSATRKKTSNVQSPHTPRVPETGNN